MLANTTCRALWTLDLLFGRDVELTERWARIRAERKQLNAA
jgi:hypothetical protein